MTAPDLGPVPQETIEQAAAMLMLAVGIDPTADVSPDTFAKLAGLRDGLLDVVVSIDERLARFTYLDHESHGANDGPYWCLLCRAASGRDLPTKVLQARWGA